MLCLLLLLMVFSEIFPNLILPSKILTHDAYIWHRVWTEALEESIMVANDRITSWHILIAESDGSGKFLVFNSNIRFFKASWKPVIPVLRLNAIITEKNQLEIIQNILKIVSFFHAKHAFSGIELDYDCPTSKLPNYRQFLIQLRQKLPEKMKITITVLPDWLRSKHIVDLLNGADEAVLQLHSLNSVDAGIFNAKDSLLWTQSFSSISPIPFRLALPNYGVSAIMGPNGSIMAVESEMPIPSMDMRKKEIKVNPRETCSFLENINFGYLKNLEGIVWFRLPTNSDRKSWSLHSWLSALQCHLPKPNLSIYFVPGNSPGTSDIVATNYGDIDAYLPSDILISSSSRCNTGDMLYGYQLKQINHNLHALSSDNNVIRAHKDVTIGWVRCHVSMDKMYVKF